VAPSSSCHGTMNPLLQKDVALARPMFDLLPGIYLALHLGVLKKVEADIFEPCFVRGKHPYEVKQ